MKHKFFASKLNTVLLLILIVLMVIAIRFMLKNTEKSSPITDNDPSESQEIKSTYIYTNHGFSIELPKGYIPHEEQSEGGPAISVSLPYKNSGIVYVFDADFWEKYYFSEYVNVGDTQIGNNFFKIYKGKLGDTTYWLRKGKVGYQLFGDKEIFSTFKYTGWSPIKTETKTSFGISIDIPNNLNYSAKEGDYGVFIGLKMIEISRDNHMVVQISKEPNQARFSEDAPRGVNEWVLVDNNYPIGGTTGEYYKSKPGTPDNGILIAVPSKLVLISVSPTSFAGLPQADLDKMISSIIIK